MSTIRFFSRSVRNTATLSREIQQTTNWWYFVLLFLQKIGFDISLYWVQYAFPALRYTKYCNTLWADPADDILMIFFFIIFTENRLWHFSSLWEQYVFPVIRYKNILQHSLSRFIRRQIDDIFCYFSRKQVLTFLFTSVRFPGYSV